MGIFYLVSLIFSVPIKPAGKRSDAIECWFIVNQQVPCGMNFNYGPNKEKFFFWDKQCRKKKIL